MMKLLYIFLFFYVFIHSTLITAQTNFKRGYIITNQNDSITGWIDFRTDKHNAHQCRFKPDTDIEVVVYHPGDIYRYRFINEGKYYVSSTIRIEGQSRKVFLEYLVKGMMDLYYYRDPDTTQEYYFFEDYERGMIALTKIPDHIERSESRNDERYKGSLVYLFKDQPEMVEKPKELFFSRKTMINLAKDYHGRVCTSGEECIEFENDYKRKFIEFGFSAYTGMRIIQMDLKASQDLTSFTPLKSFSPVIGFAVDLCSPRLSRSWSIGLDVSFWGIKAERHAVEDEVRYRRYDLNTLVNNDKVGVKYSYPNGKIRPRASVGFGFLHFFNSSNSWINERWFNETLIREERKDEIFPNNNLIGYHCAIGCNYHLNKRHLLFMEVGYEQYYNKDQVRSWQMKIGYTY